MDLLKNGELLRGTTKDGSFRFLVTDATETVRTGMRLHHLSGTPASLFGRLLVAGTLMGPTLKNPGDCMTIRMDGDGPMKGLLVTARPDASVKGYVIDPDGAWDNPARRWLSPAEAIGAGQLTVIRDIDGMTPWSGSIPIASAEVGEDITLYYAQSEQTPTALSVGVMFDAEGAVKQAGGFLIQALPGAGESALDQLQTNLNRFPYFTDMRDMGVSLDRLTGQYLLKGFDLDYTITETGGYRCDCSKERFARALALLHPDELAEMLAGEGTVPVVCHFCNREYSYTRSDIGNLLKQV